MGEGKEGEGKGEGIASTNEGRWRPCSNRPYIAS